jgi:hypothetical protein
MSQPHGAKIMPPARDRTLRRGHAYTYSASSPVKAGSQIPRKINRFNGGIA